MEGESLFNDGVGLEISRIDVQGRWGMIFIGIIIVLIGRSVAVFS
jgi:monovalent cation:H+ antiporter, CPA1 family